MEAFLTLFQSILRRCRLRAIFTLAMMVLLTSCSHMHRHDGPPNFYVDETKIPNAVPKVEPLSRIGNRPYYDIAGKRYYTLRTSRHYEQVGVASWYGTMFHNHRTSNGERYDMLGMTAAHRTLPLPTYVEVTNLKNKHKIIVKVNDRGPFKPGRLIDLSYVAAKKLGMLGRGTALVKVKAIDPRTYDKPVYLSKKSTSRCSRSSSTNDNESQLIYLQIGTFHHKANAIKMQKRVATLLKLPTRILMPTGVDLNYRIQIGPIKDTTTADKISNRLKKSGIPSYKMFV